MSNTFHATPRPLPYDTDPGYYLGSRRDSLVSRRDKGSSHSQEEAEPLRSDADYEDSESFSVEGSKILESKTMDAGNEGVYIVSDDEDVCPTCLEEYTSENHFYLSCIYEWMERSEACPVCGKVMAFNETP